MYNSDLKRKVFRNLVGKWNLWRTITFPIRKNSTESFIMFMQIHVFTSKDFFICWSVGFHRLPYPSLLEFLKLFNEYFSCHIWIWRHKHWSTSLVISKSRRLTWSPYFSLSNEFFRFEWTGVCQDSQRQNGLQVWLYLTCQYWQETIASFS